MKIQKSKIGTIFNLDADCRCLDKAVELGLECAEVCSWNVPLNTPERARLLKQRAADKGVRITTLWAGVSGPASWTFTEGPLTLGVVPVQYREQRVKELCAWADFAAEAGAPAIVTHCGFLPENMTDPDYPAVVEALRTVAEKCLSVGVGFWFETGQETPVTLLRFIEAIGTPNLGINLDPGNLTMYGRGNAVDALYTFGKHVKSLHVKDGFPPAKGTELGHETKVGEGSVDFSTLVKKLFELGFDGDFTIEREVKNNEKDILDTVAFLLAL